MAKQPFLVKPISSASDDQLVKNMVTNMDTIPRWFTRCTKTIDHGLIVSAGPSTKIFLRDYKDLIPKFKPIFCIKHALPLLVGAGVIPDFCVVLDPRDIEHISTLGHKRKDLYASAPKQTKFFVASMTHPSVTKYLMENGYEVIGWHALTPEMQYLPKEYKERLGQMLITGGTSSGTRTIELAFYMGIGTVTCVGFDSSFAAPKPTNITDIKGKQRYMKVMIGDKPFWTTGELIAQGQDFERMVANEKHPSDVRVFDTGLDTSMTNEIIKRKGNPLWVPDNKWKQYL